MFRRSSIASNSLLTSLSGITGPDSAAIGIFLPGDEVDGFTRCLFCGACFSVFSDFTDDAVVFLSKLGLLAAETRRTSSALCLDPELTRLLISCRLKLLGRYVDFGR